MSIKAVEDLSCLANQKLTEHSKNWGLASLTKKLICKQVFLWFFAAIHYSAALIFVTVLGTCLKNSEWIMLILLCRMLPWHLICNYVLLKTVFFINTGNKSIYKFLLMLSMYCSFWSPKKFDWVTGRPNIYQKSSCSMLPLMHLHHGIFMRLVNYQHLNLIFCEYYLRISQKAPLNNLSHC